MAASSGLLSWVSLTERAWAGEAVDSVGLVEARAFLDEYHSSSAAQAPGFYDLYSDRAMIHARIDGRTQGIVFHGRAYKRWGRELAQSGRARPDASAFYEPTVERRGARLVIRAKRYSLTRCFWDPTYQMGLEKEGASYRIVDERLTTNPKGVCARVDPPAAPVMPMSGAAAPIRDPRLANRTSWRPLSQDEIGESALRLAQQAAAKYPAPVQMAGVQPAMTPAVAPVRVFGARTAEHLSELWVTPEN
jgi:hypothetical protein